MLRLALIGLGRWGKKIAHTITSQHLAELTYVCDPHATNEDIATPEGKTTLASLSFLQQTKDIDAVIIATPGSTHADIALPFIKRRLPVFIEKPLATSLPDAQTIADAAKQHGAAVFVGHIHLYNPAYQAVKQLVPSLGDIRLLQFESMNNGPYRNDMSALWDWAPHDIVMAFDLLSTSPTAVAAWDFNWLRPQASLPDATIARLSFGKQTDVTIHASWLALEKRKKLTIIGSKHSLVFDDTAEKKIALYSDFGPAIEATASVPIIHAQTPTISYPPVPNGQPLTKEIEAFLAMITTGQKPLTPLEQGVEVVRIISQIEAAART